MECRCLCFLLFVFTAERFLRETERPPFITKLPPQLAK